jgi:hypothetical protein
MTEKSLEDLAADLRKRLMDAASRHTADIPAADCMLYAEAARVIGQLARALGVKDTP